MDASNAAASSDLPVSGYRAEHPAGWVPNRLCKHYINGRCEHAENCKFSHDLTKAGPWVNIGSDSAISAVMATIGSDSAVSGAEARRRSVHRTMGRDDGDAVAKQLHHIERKVDWLSA